MKATKRWALAAAAGLLLSMTVVSTASANHPGQGPCQERGGGFYGGNQGGKQLTRMLRHLDLSDAQKQQVKAILARAEAERPGRDPEAKRAQMERHHQLMKAAEFDEQAAREMIAAGQARMAEMRLKQMRVKHEIMQLLTAEQKQQLQERRANRMKRLDDRF
ncbi:Spy/CpxP family protein refolding chaperone [Ferrimonas sediminicola]|nr:Spy/CpxP family protein refolding chaperone [Ferrimonas sediminicola]